MTESPPMKALEKTYKSDWKKVVFDKLGKRKLLGGYRTVQEARDTVARDLLKSRHDPIVKDLREKIRLEKEKSLTDGLTGLYNRKHLGFEAENPTGIGELQREFDEALRNKHDLSCLMIDIDYFKLYNDTFGHADGDSVLKSVANVVKKITRKTDIPFRYGGEEFLILCPETNIDGANDLAIRIKDEIAKMLGPKRQITVSIGTAANHNSAEYRGRKDSTKIANKEDLVRKADDALYYSKYKGRNRITTANDLTPEQYQEMEEFRQAELIKAKQ